jgi:hypothetical protein
MHLCQNVPFVLACFQASAAPRPENSDSEEKDALFGFDTQITILSCANASSTKKKYTIYTGMR